MDTSRRNFLGTAALGAGGFVALTGAAAAGTPTTIDDKGQAGQGGIGRDAQQLPPGAPVAYHDAKDIGEMPAFTRSLDGSKPKITSGGWAKETDGPLAADRDRHRGRPHVPRSRRIARAALARHRGRVGLCHRRPVPDRGARSVGPDRGQQLQAGRPVVLPEGPWPFDPDHRRQALPLHPELRQRRRSRSTAPSRSPTGWTCRRTTCWRRASA